MGPLVDRFKSGSSPFHWNEFLLNLMDGQASWFLVALFVCLMLAMLTARVPAWLRFFCRSRRRDDASVWTAAHQPALHEFCFLAAGMWVGMRVYRLEGMRSVTAALGFVALAMLQVTMIYLYGPPTQWSYIELGLTGTAGLFLLAKLLDRYRIGDGLAWVGRASLAVFLLSNFPQGATPRDSRSSLPYARTVVATVATYSVRNSFACHHLASAGSMAPTLALSMAMALEPASPHSQLRSVIPSR